MKPKKNVLISLKVNENGSSNASLASSKIPINGVFEIY